MWETLRNLLTHLQAIDEMLKEENLTIIYFTPEENKTLNSESFGRDPELFNEELIAKATRINDLHIARQGILAAIYNDEQLIQFQDDLIKAYREDNTTTLSR